MIPGLQVLVFVLLSLGIIVGVVKPKRIGSFILWLIVGPVLMGVAFSLGKQVFLSLPPLQQLLFVILVAVAALVILLRVALPKGVREAVIGDFIYDALKFVVRLPFKILGWIISTILGRRGHKGNI